MRSVSPSHNPVLHDGRMSEPTSQSQDAQPEAVQISTEQTLGEQSGGEQSGGEQAGGEQAGDEQAVGEQAVSQNSRVLRAPFEQRVLRDHLGRFCSGVTVLTGMSRASGSPSGTPNGQGEDGPAEDGPVEQPVGLACQSFTALSLDPPMVLVCPSRTSRSWAAIAERDTFCVNVLSAEQTEVCTTFGSRRDDKFHTIDWCPGPVTGAPVIRGSVAVLECRIAQIIEGGDHWVVLAEVLTLDSTPGEPLLFDRGVYRRLEARDTPPSLPLETLITARNSDWWF